MKAIEIEGANEFGELLPEQLLEFEQRHNIKLPEEYRSFLLQFNGGRPKPEIIDFIQYGDDQSDMVNYLGGIHNGEYWASLEWHIDSLKSRIPKGFIPIGDDPGGNAYLIGTDGEIFGQIYFWDHENEAALEEKEPDFKNMSLIANSFTEFLNKLRSE
jgi:hypothetical protein